MAVARVVVYVVKVFGVPSSRIETLSMVQVDGNELDSIFRRISRASSSAEMSLSDWQSNEMSATFPITDAKEPSSWFEYRVCHTPAWNPFVQLRQTLENPPPEVRALREHNRFKVKPMLLKRVAVLNSTRHPGGTQHLAER